MIKKWATSESKQPLVVYFIYNHHYIKFISEHAHCLIMKTHTCHSDFCRQSSSCSLSLSLYQEYNYIY